MKLIELKNVVDKMVAEAFESGIPSEEYELEITLSGLLTEQYSIYIGPTHEQKEMIDTLKSFDSAEPSDSAEPVDFISEDEARLMGLIPPVSNES